MKRINRKSIIYFVLTVLLGIGINILCQKIVEVTDCPLYLDSIGTMFAAAVAGIAPGTTVGFITNMIKGVSDTTSFYYGIISVMIAVIVGHASEKDKFKKLADVIKLLPYFILLSIPCTVLSYILYSFEIADNVAAPLAQTLNDAGAPVIFAQMIADFCIEIPDKLMSLLAAFFLTMLVPRVVRDELEQLAFKDIINDKKHKGVKTLRKQVAVVLFVSGLAIALVAFAISFKTYLEAKVEGYPDGDYDIVLLRGETFLYCSKMFSAVFGLLISIVSYSMLIVDYRVVGPLKRMTREMKQFAFDSDQGRDKSVENIEALNIRTGNEIEVLYNSIKKTVKEIDEYIDKTNEQAKTIAELNINIVITLADVVESRDMTTGYHVKRTAEYSALLAQKLKETGKYTDIITDEYIETLRVAAPLHDIGKIKIPDAILNKPGRLTEEEYEVIKTHAALGREMLEHAGETLGVTSDYIHMAKDIASYHHEWWDGGPKGYPEHLAGEDIPLSARIMAVADVFDALVSRRPYKEGYPIDKALSIMKEESGSHFDPVIIDALLEIKDSLSDVVKRFS
ncbi:MAG: HD domain-containing protein [Eubacterium sp.]|nr:HD domain-containing protein [Eubacterium sp.]